MRTLLAGALAGLCVALSMTLLCSLGTGGDATARNSPAEAGDAGPVLTSRLALFK